MGIVKSSKSERFCGRKSETTGKSLRASFRTTCGEWFINSHRISFGVGPVDVGGETDRYPEGVGFIIFMGLV